MRIRRYLGAALATVMASTGALLVTPVSASAQAPVYLQLLWVRCQDTTGELFSDEILAYSADSAGTRILTSFFEDFDETETKWFRDHAPARDVIEFTDATFIQLWERDRDPSPPGDADHVGLIPVYRNQVDTGEHEGYAFDDGEYIVRYRVLSSRP